MLICDQISVKTGQAYSRAVTLQAGTPQGSVLSPTLFNIYVNDIPLRQSATSDGGQFADDISAWASAKKKRTAMARLEISLKELKPWLNKWRIKVNPAKTQLVCFHQRGKGDSITFLGKKIVEETKLKILGATFDRSLCYKDHCTGVAKKAMSRVHLLRRLRGRNCMGSGTPETAHILQAVRAACDGKRLQPLRQGHAISLQVHTGRTECSTPGLAPGSLADKD